MSPAAALGSGKRLSPRVGAASPRLLSAPKWVKRPTPVRGNGKKLRRSAPFWERNAKRRTGPAAGEAASEAAGEAVSEAAGEAASEAAGEAAGEVRRRVEADDGGGGGA